MAHWKWRGPTGFSRTAAELLTSSGMKGATVVLDIMPNRFLEFNQLENPSGQSQASAF